MKNCVRGLASKTVRLLVITASATLLPAVSAIAAQWHNNFEEAISTAQAQKKPVLIDFSTTWCGYCKQLDATTFRDPSVLSILDRSFVRVKVDGEARADLAARYNVSAYPTIVFLDPNGYAVKTEAGFIDSRQMVSSLTGVEKQFAAPGSQSTVIAAAPASQPSLAARLLRRLPGGDKSADAQPPVAAAPAVASGIAISGRTRYGGGQVYANGSQPIPEATAPSRTGEDLLAAAEKPTESVQAKLAQDLKPMSDPETETILLEKTKVTAAAAKSKTETDELPEVAEAPQAAPSTKVEAGSVSMYNLPENVDSPKPLIARSVTDKIVGTPGNVSASAFKKDTTDADQLSDQLATIRKLQGLKFPARREIAALPSSAKGTASDAGSSLPPPVKMALTSSAPPVLKLPKAEEPLPAPVASKSEEPSALPQPAKIAVDKVETQKPEDGATSKALAKVSQATDDKTPAADIKRWYEDANTKLKGGYRREARAMYNKVVDNDLENKSGLADMAFIRMAGLIVDSDDDVLRKKAHAKISEFEARYPKSENKDYYTLVRAILAVDLGQKEEAVRLLETYPDRFPKASAKNKERAYELYLATTGAKPKTSKTTAAATKPKTGSTKSSSSNKTATASSTSKAKTGSTKSNSKTAR